jgi:two-component system cell cycle response regulator
MDAQRNNAKRLGGASAWLSWSAWLVAAMTATVLLYGIELLYAPLPASVSLLFQKFAANAVFFGAAALCVRRARAAREDRSAWWLLGLAMTLWGTGGLYYAVFLWGREVIPIPSVADFFWIVYYLPAYAALYMLLRRSFRSAGRGVLLDALVGALGVGGAGAALAFQTILANTEGTALATATNLAYPIGDLGLLGLIVAGITVVGWKASGVWRWIAPAFLVFAVADSVYLVRVAQGVYGGLVDLGWPAAALLVGLAAWRPERRARSTARRESTILLSGAFGSAALVLLVVDHFSRMNPLALALSTASILVILVRLYLTVQENGRMLAHSRLEATTDALTGLGNRRQLRADLAAHADELDPERPLMLTLFDLDGFKQYNDTYGHLAGDQLLERLGVRLTELLAGRGTAYRMGGDEFCTLWHVSDLSEESVSTTDAVNALSEQGEGFSIGCSHGSALLPNEAIDTTEALRMADRRMYIRKGSGRISAGRQSSDVLLRALAERDTRLGVHLDDVAELACATALRLGVPEEQMEAARQSALLHDVGKVAIPDEILSKPGPLDEAEWAFVKRHTVIGERIISAAPALASVAKSVRSTHERYDGDGYPDGLGGDEIPLIARIVAVCDAYDAMITERAYRQARGKSKAVTELRRCSGTQFDPEVVEAFISCLEDVEELRRVALEEGGLPLAHPDAEGRQPVAAAAAAQLVK